MPGHKKSFKSLPRDFQRKASQESHQRRSVSMADLRTDEVDCKKLANHYFGLEFTQDIAWKLKCLLGLTFQIRGWESLQGFDVIVQNPLGWSGPGFGGHKGRMDDNGSQLFPGRLHSGHTLHHHVRRCNRLWNSAGLVTNAILAFLLFLGENVDWPAQSCKDTEV